MRKRGRRGRKEEEGGGRGKLPLSKVRVFSRTGS